MCLRVLVGQTQLSHFSLLGDMKPDKQGNYAAPYSGKATLGGIKQRRETQRSRSKVKAGPERTLITRC